MMMMLLSCLKLPGMTPVMTFLEPSFRRKDREGNIFNPSIFFRYWKNVKAFTSPKLPNWYPNHRI